MQSQPGAILSERQYRLHHQLYQDGPLQYWSARQLSDGNSPVRKLLQIPLPIYIRHDERKQQFEAQRHYHRLQDTPHVVSIEYIETREEPHFLAFATPPGQILYQLLHSSHRRDHAMPWDLAVYVTVQTCLALHQAHVMPDPVTNRPFILHGDLRPESLYLTENGTIQLLPFQQLHLWGDLREAWPLAVKRRYAYAAPERWQEEGAELDPQIDLFAVGVLLYELITGQLPHNGTTVEAVQKQILSPSLPSLRSHISNLPSRLEATIYQLIHPSPSERPDSAGELAQLLVQLLEKDTGVEGYQKKLADYCLQQSQPFPQIDQLDTFLPTQVNGATAIRVPSDFGHKPASNSRVSPPPVETHDTAVTPSLLADDLPTQASSVRASVMSNKDPFSTMPESALLSANPQPKNGAPSTQTSVPQPGDLASGARPEAGPFTPASPFLASTPEESALASRPEIGYNPSESTMIDGGLMRALRASMEQEEPEEQASAFAHQGPLRAPARPPIPRSLDQEERSVSGFTGRFKRYTPPSQEELDAQETSEKQQAPPTSSTNQGWNPAPGATPSGPPANPFASRPQTPSPFGTGPAPAFGSSPFPQEDDDDAPTSIAPGGALSIPPPPPGFAPPGHRAPAHNPFAAVDIDDDDGEATTLAPPGALQVPSAPPSRAMATAAPPAPSLPPRIGTPPGYSQPGDVGEDTGKYSTIPSPKSNELDYAPTMASPPQSNRSAWSPPTAVDGNLPTQTGANRNLENALFSFQADDDEEDATMLQAPSATGASFSFATQQNYGMPSPSPAPPPPGRLPQRATHLAAEPAPHTLSNPNEVAISNSLFSAAPENQFDPAQPLAPSLPEYPISTEASGPSTAPEPMDFGMLDPQRAAAHTKTSRGWLIPVLLLLLLGGGAAASVAVLGWPPWKSLLAPSTDPDAQKQLQKRKLARAKARVRDRSLDGIVLDPGARPQPLRELPPVDRVVVPPQRERPVARRPQARKVEPRKVEPRRRTVVRRPEPRRVRRRPIRRRVRRVIARKRRRVIRRQPPRRRRVARRSQPKPRRIKVAAITSNASGVRISIQPACTVYRGRRKLGRSYPPRSFNLPPGQHNLRCVNRGKRIIHNFSLLVVQGQPIKYTRNLRPGKVLIRSRPWSTIYIKGLGKVGKTGQTLTIYEGRYKVTLYKEGSTLPTPGNRQSLFLIVQPNTTSKPALVVFPVLDDD